MSNNENIETVKEVSLERQTPGMILRAARLRLGVSEHEVMDHTGLSPRFLEAIESDDLSKLPADAYVRGYIRGYCKMLGISYADTMASYAELRGEVFADNQTGEQTGVESQKRAKLVSLSVVVSVILVLLGWWLLNSSQVLTDAPLTLSMDFERITEQRVKTSKLAPFDAV